MYINKNIHNYKVAVITPYYKEGIEILKQCHQSVLIQDANVTHFMIADGYPNKEVNAWDCTHITLPRAHGDNGNTPRGIGGLLAEAEGYDFIAFLDADNWYQANHLSTLLKLHDETSADVMCSFRVFHRLDGSILPISEDAENTLEHVDTSCFLISKNAFDCLSAWIRMPKKLSPICDRIFYRLLKHRRLHIVYSKLRTVCFRSQYLYHYEIANEQPPQDHKDGSFLYECNSYLKSSTGIKECLDRLGFWPLYENK